MRTWMSLAQPNASPWVQDYTYNAVMRLSGVWSPAGTFSYNYATGGGDRVEAIDLPDSQGPWYGTSVEYDGLARPFYLQIFTPKTRFYDQYSYDDGSEVTQQVFTAGNYLNYTYDNIGQLKTALGHESGGTTPRLQEQFGYGYDKAWNLNYRTNNAMLQQFNVNDLNELTTTTNGRSLTVAGATTSVATNVTVNSVTAALYGDATFAQGGFTIANGNNIFTAIAKDSYGRLATNISTVNLPITNSYLYDLNGNLTNDGNRSFAYDDENELTSVWVASAWSNNFVYDGKMRRRIERDYTWSGGTWVENNEVHYIYDGNVVVQERDQNNLPKVTYMRGLDLSGTLQGAGGIGGLLARTDNSKLIIGDAFATAFYHADGNGNVTYLLYQNQTLAAKYLYDPYGNMLGMSGSLAAANHYRFSSKEWNDNDGLYYYLYRFYDPNLQRWPNQDPKNEQGFEITLNHKRFKKMHITLRMTESSLGPNLYAFAGNMPVNRFDPLGLSYDSEECAGLLNEIDFLYSLLGRNGIDSNSVQQQINDLEDEYDENCGDDDGDNPSPAPAPAPSCPIQAPSPVPSFCLAHPALCGLGIGTGIAITVCILQPELCIPAIIIAK